MWKEMLVEDCERKVNLFLPYSKSGWGFGRAEQLSRSPALPDTLPCRGGDVWAGLGAQGGAGASAEPRHTEPHGPALALPNTRENQHGEVQE